MVHRHRLLTSQVCRPPLGMSDCFTAPILVLQDNYRCHPRGWRRGCCTCYGCTYPLKPGVGVVKKELSWNRSCLNVRKNIRYRMVAMSYVLRHRVLRCRTCLTYDIDIRCRTSGTYDIVGVRCRTCMTYDIVCNIGIIRCRTSDVRHRTSARIQMLAVVV